MKKILIGTSAAVALAFALSFSATTPAQAGDASAFCKANNDFSAFSVNGFTHGQCTSFFAGGNSGPVTGCKWLRDNLPLAFDANFKNLGACVSFWRSL